jgi:hypothetical protein
MLNRRHRRAASLVPGGHVVAGRGRSPSGAGPIGAPPQPSASPTSPSDRTWSPRAPHQERERGGRERRGSNASTRTRGTDVGVSPCARLAQPLALHLDRRYAGGVCRISPTALPARTSATLGHGPPRPWSSRTSRRIGCRSRPRTRPLVLLGGRPEAQQPGRGRRPSAAGPRLGPRSRVAHRGRRAPGAPSPPHRATMPTASIRAAVRGCGHAPGRAGRHDRLDRPRNVPSDV